MRKFPGGPVVRTQLFHCQSPSLIPARGAKILQAAQCSQKRKKNKNKNRWIMNFMVYNENSKELFIYIFMLHIYIYTYTYIHVCVCCCEPIKVVIQPCQRNQRQRNNIVSFLHYYHLSQCWLTVFHKMSLEAFFLIHTSKIVWIWVKKFDLFLKLRKTPPVKPGSWGYKILPWGFSLGLEGNLIDNFLNFFHTNLSLLILYLFSKEFWFQITNFILLSNIFSEIW